MTNDPSRLLIVASNRGPVSYSRAADGSLTARRGGGGMVSGLTSGLGAVAADGGAHRETVGVEGWLFPPGDVAACARLLDAIEIRDLAVYGDNLRSRQLKLFDIESHTDQLLKLYLGLTSRE